jgi:hypothetical protein
MPYGLIKFRSTVVKPFYIKELLEIDEEDQNELQREIQLEIDIK